MMFQFDVNGNNIERSRTLDSDIEMQFYIFNLSTQTILSLPMEIE